MAAVLGTNVASLWASKNLQSAQSNMANSVERLGPQQNIARMLHEKSPPITANGPRQLARRSTL